MSENNIIKSITIHSCPHCGKDVYVESQMTPPVVGTLFTKVQMDEAKSDCLERVKVLAIDEDKKEAIVKWLEDEKTVFGPDEVESIILSILKPEE